MTTKTIDPQTMTLAELDAEIEHERVRFIAAGDEDDQETFVDSFFRLLSLYESHSQARGQVENGP